VVGVSVTAHVVITADVLTAADVKFDKFPIERHWKKTSQRPQTFNRERFNRVAA